MAPKWPRCATATAQVGAVATFIGTVRDRSDGAHVTAMELEHYPGMTEAAIEAMVDEARRRFDIRGARVDPPCRRAAAR